VPTNPGWGGAPAYATSSAQNAIANQAALAKLGYKTDVPGTPANPSAPFSDFIPLGGQSAWGSPQDYQQAITSQWDYGAAAEAARNQELADQAAQRAAIGRYATDYGGDLSGLVGEGLIGSDVAAAGAANPSSFMAQLTRALGQGQARDVGDLNARGTLDSGAYGIAQSNRLRDFQTQGAAGLTTLRGQIGDVISGNASRAEQRAAQMRSTTSDIAARLSQDPAYQPRAAVASETAVWNGQVYVTKSGKRYDINGRPV
jgi:hypothetical protein